MKKIRHPAKYTDSFLPVFFEELKGTKNVLDPMGGTGKIGKLKEYGYEGRIYSNELESEWALQGYENGCDVVTMSDAEKMEWEDEYFDAICTSPTYGNRMADSHEAKDESKRNTYTHSIGRKLHEENTGKMQWGKNYQDKHRKIYNEINRVLKPKGKFILNIKNHIRKGEEVDVSSFHKELMLQSGFTLSKEVKVPVRGNGFGQNGNIRVDHEFIFIFEKEV